MHFRIFLSLILVNSAIFSSFLAICQEHKELISAWYQILHSHLEIVRAQNFLCAAVCPMKKTCGDLATFNKLPDWFNSYIFRLWFEFQCINSGSLKPIRVPSACLWGFSNASLSRRQFMGVHLSTNLPSFNKGRFLRSHTEYLDPFFVIRLQSFLLSNQMSQFP